MTSDKPLEDAAKEELLTAITAEVMDFKNEMHKQTREMEGLEDFPMESALPMAMMYMVTPMLESVDFDENFINLGASVEHFGLLSDK